MNKVLILIFLFSIIIFSQNKIIRQNDLDSILTARGFDSLGVDANFDSLYTKLSQSTVYVMDYVATHDTTVSWNGAIQAAMDNFLPVGDGRRVAGTNIGGTIVFPDKRMTINAPIKWYSGVSCVTSGNSSELYEGAGFTGRGMIEIHGINYYMDDIHIKDLRITSTTQPAIVNNYAGITNSDFRNLTLDCPNGIILDEYSQSVVIENIYSMGTVDTLIYLEGNFCFIRQIDKEGYSGSTASAYIIINRHDAARSSGITLENILIEGICNANKSAIMLNGVAGVTLSGIWYEPTASDGYTLRIQDCDKVFITSYFTFGATRNKIKIDSTNYVRINDISIDGEDFPLDDYIEKDLASTVIFNSLETRGYDSPLRLEKLKEGLFINHLYNRVIHTDSPVGLLPSTRMNYLSSNNFLSNPSFESGAYGWTTSGAVTPDSTAFMQSEVSKGLMAQIFYDALTTSQLFYQNITISFADVPLTFTALVKADSGTGFIAPYINGCGITGVSTYNRANVGDGWHIISLTFTPQSTGTLRVGVWGVNCYAMYLDEMKLSSGTDAMINSNQYNDIQLDNNTISYGSTAPTTGTWKQGDVIFNNSTDDEDYVGWVCTSAGTPGTWTQFGGTIGTRGGLYEKAITITPLNSTGDALTVNGTQKTTGYTYGYHELPLSLLNMTTDDTVTFAYTTADREIDSIRYLIDDSLAFNIRYGTDGTGTSIFTTPDTLIGSGVITSFDNNAIPINSYVQIYPHYLGNTALSQFLKIYYHDYDTLNVYAVNFNGTNEDVEINNPSDMDITGVGSEFTIMAWVKSPDVSTASQVDIARRYFGYDYWYLSRDTGKPYFGFDDGSGLNQLIADAVAQDSVWYHVAISIDTDSARFYVNGVWQTSTIGSQASFNDAPYFDIGCWRASYDKENYSNSTIGEVQIINSYALTTAEILNAYNLTYAGGHYPASYLGGDVVAWYKWSGDNDSEFLEDASASGNDLTGTNVDKAGDQVIINGGYK